MSKYEIRVPMVNPQTASEDMTMFAWVPIFHTSSPDSALEVLADILVQWMPARILTKDLSPAEEQYLETAMKRVEEEVALAQAQQVKEMGRDFAEAQARTSPMEVDGKVVSFPHGMQVTKDKNPN